MQGIQGTQQRHPTGTRAVCTDFFTWTLDLLPVGVWLTAAAAAAGCRLGADDWKLIVNGSEPATGFLKFGDRQDEILGSSGVNSFANNLSRSLVSMTFTRRLYGSTSRCYVMYNLFFNSRAPLPPTISLAA
ncbi:hypothetical protein F2P81_015592 [Scophthalmus maximus]|uniref:Uncharacterized protein n=1 Tax=Scophthalmus maximus TaxID=52904 RepID=A0A6A4ST75_SCOMX|nr:hypothetical protein F2P81_015592 [Scophthalmus maximus]